MSYTKLCCLQCQKYFFARNAELKRNNVKFCSLACCNKHKFKQQEFSCLVCNTKFLRKNSDIKKVKNVFCSHSCAAKYNNSNKTHGVQRSKLEIYIESQLNLLYPQLHILYNNVNIINSELDIYIPSLNLAFELNGIFHYEPIFGNDKLNKTINNDNRKMQACLENSIELCVIDVTSQRYFKETSAQKFLHIITTIINKKMETGEIESQNSACKADTTPMLSQSP